ncbi:MAG: fumarate hydratase C-terminal domain-containing protein [Spirochaetes bacterium]|uniref:Fumarate hydratase C-terminal domain-containing protein n=1 Tax=Candidatus Ornithospirochaeta stercoripullorum TaxID=2840899 RepID=A0A9D9E238_9SPIO|nr:fumarate hydratase C-terminal domain-containing protein [Candidatus Ornithospirochaeta stercoripullorum]
MTRRLELPYAEQSIEAIEAGDDVLLSGTLYVGRDQVHKKLCEALSDSLPLPFPFEGNAIYYMGPSPAPEGFPIGSAGPTTSARMDRFSPSLITAGLKVMVGKGPRSEAVADSVKTHKGLYLQAFGGCGALYSSCILSSELVAYPELGPEALLRLIVKDFPVICVIDSAGRIYRG